MKLSKGVLPLRAKLLQPEFAQRRGKFSQRPTGFSFPGATAAWPGWIESWGGGFWGTSVLCGRVNVRLRFLRRAGICPKRGQRRAQVGLEPFHCLPNGKHWNGEHVWPGCGASDKRKGSWWNTTCGYSVGSQEGFGECTCGSPHRKSQGMVQFRVNSWFPPENLSALPIEEAPQRGESCCVRCS